MRVRAAFVVVLGLAGRAFGEFQYPTQVTGHASASGADIVFTNVDNGEGAPNGTVVTARNQGATTQFATFRFTFPTAVDNPSLILYGLDTGGGTISLVRLDWTSGTGFNSGVHADFTLSITGGPTDYELLASTGSFLDGGGSTPFVTDTYVRSFVRFQLDPGEQVSFDAISNPEPGTLALFGIGVVGLGVLVRRRRRAARLSTR